MTKFADQWEPNGPFGIVTDSNMSGGYRVVTNDADKTDITILPPERQKVGMLVYVTATNKTWRLTTVGVRSPGTETYSVNPVFTDATVSVGTAISGGTADSVLYIDSAGNLAQSADLKYVASSKVLTAGALTFDGTNGHIYRTSYGTLSIGNDGNTSSILIGTLDNDDSVVIGRASGPDTYVDSNLFVKGTLTMYGPDKTMYTTAIDATGGSTLVIGSAPGTTQVTIGRVGGSAVVDSTLNVNSGAITRSSTGALTIGNSAAVNAISIGTVNATGGVLLGSVTNAVGVNGVLSVDGVLNANGGIGRSTNGALDIGNDTNVTTGINIGTVSAAGGVKLGSTANDVTIQGTGIIGVRLRPDVSGGADVGMSTTRFGTVYAQSANFSDTLGLTLNGITIGAASNIITIPAKIYSAPATNVPEATITLEQDYVGDAGVQNPTLSPGAVSTDVGVLLDFISSSGLTGSSISNTEDYPVQIATNFGPNLQCGAIKVRLKIGGVVTRGFIRVWFTPAGA